MTAPGLAVAGHFGEWLQGRLGPNGPVVLVTLPCPSLAVEVRAAERGERTTVFAEDRLREFLARLGLPGDHLPAVSCAMPLGGGAGASTATLVAVARWAGYTGSPETLARACLATEGATDPLMWPDPDRLLWASREAHVIRHMAPPPRCEILGGFWGAPARTDPADTEFCDISDLVEEWDRAVALHDLAGAARIATVSADRCRARRGPADPMAELAHDLRALGHVRAHTGSARGLVFAPGTVPPHGRDVLVDAGLTGVLSFMAGRDR